MTDVPAPKPTEAELERLLRWANVSRETIDRLQVLVTQLCQWQRKINLVSGGTIRDIWARHILDSAQLWRYIPEQSESVVDIGSGAGFPGLVLGVLSAQAGGPLIHLVESDSRKAAFLSTVSHLTKARAVVHACRIEGLAPLNADVVTARACAPLVRLLGWADPHLKPGGVCVFPKGRTAEAEVEEARTVWAFSLADHQSGTDSKGRILVLTDIARLSPSPKKGR